MTIRQNLTLWFTLLVGFIVILTGLIGWLGMRENLYSSSVEDARDKAREVQELISTIFHNHQIKNIPFKIEDPELLHYTLSAEKVSIYDGVFLQVVNIKGHIFARSPNLGKHILPVNKVGTVKRLKIYLSHIGNVDILYYCAPIKVENDLVASLQVGIPLLKTENFLKNLMLYDLLAMLFAMTASLFLGQFLSQRALQPMMKITREVENMAGKDIFKKLDISYLPKDEIKHLGETFNRLMERISETFKFNQRFLSDVSHELRSPLTSIRGHAQLLLKRGKDNPSMLEESLKTITYESERLGKLVDDLLLLAHSQEKRYRKDRINIVILLEQVVNDLQPLHSGLSLLLPELKPELMVSGDQEAIKRIFINLLNNAFKATANHGNAIVKLEIKMNKVSISVIDDGPGVDPAHIPHLFERFYRVDSARDRSKGGTGLGLAIVKELVEIHGGEINITSLPGKGANFIVTLPLIT